MSHSLYKTDSCYSNTILRFPLLQLISNQFMRKYINHTDFFNVNFVFASL